MYFGCPSVARRAGGIPEVVEDNVSGLRPNYGCNDGRFVFGNPDETRSGWMVQLGASQSGPLAAQIGVTNAWLFANR